MRRLLAFQCLRRLSTRPPPAKPRIAVFSGPQSTVANSAPLLTSNQARRRRGLPLRMDVHGEPLQHDAPRLQRLAAPVDVLIAQHSEHPLAADAADLHGPPDGWCDPRTGEFSAELPKDSSWVACYKATLRPEDGHYALPFMGVTRSGQAWDDASELYAQIDQTGWNADGDNCLLTRQARYDFYRACPPAGYTRGLSAHARTDSGSVSAPSAHTDVPPERIGDGFYPYYPYHLASTPTAAALLAATNLVQRTVRTSSSSSSPSSATAPYLGVQWLEASCSIEETLYWLSLIIDTHLPIVGHAAQRPHGTIGSDGGINIVNGVRYICSGIWAAAAASEAPVTSSVVTTTSTPTSTTAIKKDAIGAVLVVDDQAFSAREVAKTDARPGNYEAVGGHGGVVASLQITPMLTFVPVRKATWRSELNLSRLPRSVAGVAPGGGTLIDVRVMSDEGELRALPRVGIVKAGHYSASEPRAQELAPFNGTRGVHARVDDVAPGETARAAVGVIAELDAALADAPLAGFVAEGANPYGYLDENAIDAALLRAVFSGLPVVRVARGNTGGFCYPAGPFFIAGSNLTATKARVLLQAAILKLGALPPAIDSGSPTSAERVAIAQRVSEYQYIFDTH